jgi:hypothetical protein
MKWYGTLRKSGVIELKREWKPGEAKSALARLRPGEEIFGPFDAPTFRQAVPQLKLMMLAVGFREKLDGQNILPKC